MLLVISHSYPAALKFPMMIASEQLSFTSDPAGKRSKTGYERLMVN